MSLNRGMDTETVVNILNGVLSAIKNNEILRQMDGTRKCHPERGNPVTKECTWYALTNKQMLAQRLKQVTIHPAQEAQEEGGFK